MNPYSDKLWMVYDALAFAFNPDMREKESSKDDHQKTDEQKENQETTHETTDTSNKTIYTKDDEEIKKLYELIMQGQSLEKEFDNGMIKDFEDLLKLEKKQKDTKVSQLYEQMEELEKQEKKAADSFDQKYYDLNDTMNQLSDEVEMDQKSLLRMEETLQ